MKKLQPLDKIVLDIAIEDFKDGKLGLNEVNRTFNNYEHKGFDTSEQRMLLNVYIEKKIIYGGK